MMPIDNKGRIVCVTHKDEPMLRQAGYYFLTEVEKTRSSTLNIRATQGIPLITFVCKICGYIENYAAMAIGDWKIKRLYVKCKNEKCKREFLSPMQMNEESFKTSKLEHNSYVCYYCKQSNMYDKEDHFFK